MDVIRALFADYTLRNVVLGVAILGAVSGALGSFAVLRRQALLGDAMAHAALPGIVLAFLITGQRDPLILLIGAGVAAWLGAMLLLGVTRTTRIKEDSGFALILAVFFGFGLVLLSFAQRRPDAAQAGLNSFLFGQAAAMVTRDVVTIASIGSVALLILAIFWKQFKLISFDPDFAHSIGLPVRNLSILLTSLLIVAIVLGLQTVGVVLMSAMLVAPAAAARQWTNQLGVMVLLAASFGTVSGVAGALISSTARGLSTGPTIVLCVSAIVLVSLLFAPERGLLWKAYKRGVGGRVGSDTP